MRGSRRQASTPNAMDHDRDEQDPPRPEDQKQLNCDHSIDDEKGVSNTREHLWPRKC